MITTSQKTAASVKLVKEDTPIYKLRELGAKALSDRELLIQVLGMRANEQSLTIAGSLLRAVDNNLMKLFSLTAGEIFQIEISGVTQRMAASIAAMGELMRRRGNRVIEGYKIQSSGDAYEVLRPAVEDLPHEQFHIMTMNRKNRVIRIHQISQGGLTATTADPRIIFQKALIDKATSIILCHNHPSGSITPSTADIDLTKKMISIGKLMEIQVFDHLIITTDKYYSFADEGMM